MKILEINKEDLKNNIEIIQNIIKEKEKNTSIIAVVKANRNGIGARRIFEIFNRKWNKTIGCRKF